MLFYFRGYLIAAYALAIAVPVVVTTIIAMTTGVAVSATIPGIFLSLAILVVSTFVMMRIMNGKADRKTAELLDLYNTQCNPEAFVVQAAPVASRIRPPYDRMGAWFMSYYAMALADLGRFEEAAEIGEGMQQTAALAKDDAGRASVLLSLEPIVLRLFGPAAALPVIDEVLELFSGAQGPETAERRAFMQNERELASKRVSGDDDWLLERYRTVRRNEDLPLRGRVLYANLEAEICRRRGDAVRERECLEFVAAHGGGLPAVPFARQRLAEMQGAPSISAAPTQAPAVSA